MAHAQSALVMEFEIPKPRRTDSKPQLEGCSCAARLLFSFHVFCTNPESRETNLHGYITHGNKNNHGIDPPVFEKKHTDFWFYSGTKQVCF